LRQILSSTIINSNLYLYFILDEKSSQQPTSDGITGKKRPAMDPGQPTVQKIPLSIHALNRLPKNSVGYGKTE